jgi:hypothetical protein
MDYVEYGVESIRKTLNHFDVDFGLEIEIEQEIDVISVGVMVLRTRHLIDQRASREQP